VQYFASPAPPPPTQNISKPAETKLISASAPFPAATVASSIVRAMRRGHFQAYTGLDGFMLAKLTAGMSPQPAPFEAVTELLLMPLFRAVALVYLKVFSAGRGVRYKWASRVGGGQGQQNAGHGAEMPNLGLNRITDVVAFAGAAILRVVELLTCGLARTSGVGAAGGEASAQGQARRR
jgi:hypothetical protein